jgi:hypothetical protein
MSQMANGTVSSAIRPRVSSPSFAALMLTTGTTALSTDTYIAALPLVTGAVSDARGAGP